MKLSRRQVLVGGGLSMVGAFAPTLAWGQIARTRYSVDSPDGDRMLEKYARAVAIMRGPNTPEASPRSWLYQWYIHAIPGEDKQGELRRIYGAGNSPAKALAAEVWQTCQAHRFGNDPHMFLPWHRMYLLAFEDIIRAVLGDDEFTLPYWDYTLHGKRVLPLEFRRPGHAVFGALFVPNRKKDGQVNINGGDAMDKGAANSPFNLSAMRRPKYDGTSGFCQAIDGQLHGHVHVGVGNGTNMGAVPTAAGDPIFWLHHCMIDRIWAGWNQEGGHNPQTSEKFSFAGPDGARREFDAADMGDTARLGYRYDTLPSLPPGTARGAVSAQAPLRLAASAAAETILGSGPTRIPLRPVAGGQPTATAVAALPANQRLYLVIDRLRTNLAPEVLYEVFLDLPENADAQARRKHYAGTLNFFGRTIESKIDTGVSIDATDVLKALNADPGRSGEPVLTIIPVQPPAVDAAPRIGAISVERQ